MPRAAAPARSDPAALGPEIRILILHGKERFLQDEYLKKLREALAEEHGAGRVDTVRFDGSQGSRILADVLDECRSQGLMQQHKIVVVDNADQLVKAGDDDAPAPAVPRAGKRRIRAPHSARELLEAYAEDPSDSATLVLRADTWRPGNLDKAVERVGAVRKCEPPSEDKAITWAQARAKARHQTSIDAPTAAMLVETVGADLGRIDTELEKLALSAGGEGQPITAALVESMVGTTRKEAFWSIQAALLSGDPGAALTQLRDLIEVSRHDPVPITFSFVDLARKVHLAARGRAQGVSDNRILGALRLFGPGANELGAGVLRAAAAGPARAARLLAEAVGTDAANKSGLGDPVRNLERLVMRFHDLLRPAPAARGDRSRYG